MKNINIEEKVKYNEELERWTIDITEYAKEILQLNNLKTFKEEGFKIKRNKEVITLNSDEMDLFKFFYMASDGQGCLDYHMKNTNNDKEIETINKLKEDSKLCFDIESEILEKLYENCDIVERIIIKKYIEKYQ